MAAVINQRQKQDLDNHITGHYGEDQFRGEEDLLDLAQFKTVPFKHQLEGIRQIVEKTCLFLMDEPGVGKSKQVIDAACLLMRQGEIKQVIVVCPASVKSAWLHQEWGQLAQHAFVPSTVTDFTPKAGPITRYENYGGETLYWVVCSYELLRQKSHLARLIATCKLFPTLLVFDESSFIKNRQATQTRASLELRRHAARVVLLNGTPITRDPLDLWAQVCVLKRDIFKDYKNYYHFRASFAVMGGYQGKQVLKWINLDKLQALLKPYCLRRLTADCLDLPAQTFTVREVPLCSGTWAAYKSMRQDALAALATGETSVASHAIVKLVRLSQLTSGILAGAVDGQLQPVVPQRISQEKVLAAQDWVQDLTAQGLKTVVWARFVQDLDRLLELMAEARLPARVLKGGQGKRTRDELEAWFRGPEVGPLLGQPQAGGLGLNYLVAAHHVLRVGSDYNWMSYIQSEKRTHRPGQTEPVFYTDLLATGPDGQKTIDHIIYRALHKKEDLATWTAARWREELA